MWSRDARHRACLLPPLRAGRCPVARFHFDDAERVLTSDFDSPNLPFIEVNPPVPFNVPPSTLIPGRAVRSSHSSGRRIPRLLRSVRATIDRYLAPSLSPRVRIGSFADETCNPIALAPESASSSERSSWRGSSCSQGAHPRSDRIGTTPCCSWALSLATDL